MATEGSRATLGEQMAELRCEWRALLAATIGNSAGVGLYYYVVTLFVPALQREFGWTSGQMAGTTLAVMPLIIVLPLCGMLIDRLGVAIMIRVSTALGVIVYLLMAGMSGSLWLYYGLVGALFMLGAGTTSITWLRVVAKRFDRSRGIALAIGLSGSGLMAAFAGPLLNMLIDMAGWRSGYIALAALTCLGQMGGLRILKGDASRTSAARAATVDPARQEETGYTLREALKKPLFWMALAALMSINLASPVILNQMKPMILHLGHSSTIAGIVLSIYGAGMVIGRLAVGLALDRFPTLESDPSTLKRILSF